MNIGDIIAQKGIIIRGNVVIDKSTIITSIIKNKIRARATKVVHTTIAPPMGTKAQIAKELQIAETSLFKDEMKRLGAVKAREDRKIHLGTRHLRKKEKITTHANIKLDEFSFAEAMAVTSDKQLRKLGRIHSNFDDIEMRATNK